MSELKNRISKISNYKNANFNNKKSIGVICRGPSVHSLNRCCDKFDCCYLSGEFNHTLSKIKRHIIGKQIVLCTMQDYRYRTPVELCKELNIENIQTKHQTGTQSYRDCIKKFADLKVTGFSKNHYEIVNKVNIENENNRTIFSTGTSGIISALYFKPSNIYIIGMDFYNRCVKPYYVREDHDVPYDSHIQKSILGLREGMIKTINGICKSFPDTNLHIYTTYHGIISKNNLRVVYV